MVDLYRDIDWADAILENREEYTDFAKILQSECETEQETPEFKGADWRIPVKNTSFSNFVILIGAPQVPQEKINIVKSLFIKKILPKLNLTDAMKNMKVDYQEGSKTTSGTIVFEFESQDAAKVAAAALEGLILDASHTFSAFTFDEYDEIMQTEDNFDQPNFLTQQQLFSWINDEQLRDQFIFKCGDTVSPYWFNNVEKTNEKIEKRISKPGVKGCKFSVNGEYLIVMERTGVSVFGGENWDLITKFAHTGVKDVKLSPLGKYLLTYNGTAVEANNSENIIVWNFLTGKKLRRFQSEKPEIWATFEFSHDETYLAGIIETEPKDNSAKENILCVFDPTNMSILAEEKSGARRPLQVLNPQKFKWANNSNMMVVVCWMFGEERAGKSMVQVIELPSRNVYTWNKFTIDFLKCKIGWEKNDKYILLELETFGRKKIDRLLQVGILDRKARKVYVNTTELHEKFIQRIEVDENSQRIAVFHKETEKELKVRFTVYAIAGDQKTFVLKEIIALNDPDFRFEQIIWSKIPNYFCLFDKKGNFRFAMLKEKSHKEKGSNIDVVKNEIEFLCKDLNVTNSVSYSGWDPSGRFMAVFSERDNRVSVFNIYGDMAFTADEEKASQFCWRPRKVVNLNKQEEDLIKKNQKKYFEVYNDEDEKILNHQEYVEKQLIKAREDTFHKYMNMGRKRWEDLKDTRTQTLGWDEDIIENPVKMEMIDKDQLIEEISAQALAGRT